MPEVARRVMGENVGLPALEPINEPIYDTQTYPVAGTSSLTFFAAGLGTRTLRETNVPIAGVLPNPQQFHVYGVQIVPSFLGSSSVVQSTVVTDLATIVDNSFFRLFIGTKSYVEVCTCFIPNGHGISGFASTTVGARELASVHNGVAHQNNFYDVTVKMGHQRKPIHLPPQQNFRAELVFPGPAAATITTNVTIGGTASGGLPIKVFLLGIKWREVQ